MDEHADVVRQLAQAVAAFPAMADEDRAELQAVIQDWESIARLFDPEGGSLQIVNLLARHERDLLARIHAIGAKHNRHAS